MKAQWSLDALTVFDSCVNILFDNKLVCLLCVYSALPQICGCQRQRLSLRMLWGRRSLSLESGCLSGISRLTTHHPGILQVATVLAFLPSWQKSFWNQAECFPLSWYTLEAGMQACSQCSCHKEKHGNLTLRRFHGILGLNKQQVANHVLVRTLASWGRGCTRLHSYPLCRSCPPHSQPPLDGLTGKAHPCSRFG